MTKRSSTDRPREADTARCPAGEADPSASLLCTTSGDGKSTPLAPWGPAQLEVFALFQVHYERIVRRLVLLHHVPRSDAEILLDRVRDRLLRNPPPRVSPALLSTIGNRTPVARALISWRRVRGRRARWDQVSQVHAAPTPESLLAVRQAVLGGRTVVAENDGFADDVLASAEARLGGEDAMCDDEIAQKHRCHRSSVSRLRTRILEEVAEGLASEGSAGTRRSRARD